MNLACGSSLSLRDTQNLNIRTTLIRMLIIQTASLVRHSITCKKSDIADCYLETSSKPALTKSRKRASTENQSHSHPTPSETNDIQTQDLDTNTVGAEGGIQSAQFPATPGMPLFAVSPKRVNFQDELHAHPHRDYVGSENTGIDSLKGRRKATQLSDFSNPTCMPLCIIPPEPPNILQLQPLRKIGVEQFEPLDTTSVDIQDKAVQFNKIGKEVVQKRKDHEAALKRAVMGREEAELELQKFRDEGEKLKKEIDEGKKRETDLGTKLEDVKVTTRATIVTD